VLLGGALLLREIVRLVDFGVRHLQFNLVSRPYVHRRTTRQHGPWLAAGETFILDTPTLHRILSRTLPWRT